MNDFFGYFTDDEEYDPEDYIYIDANKISSLADVKMLIEAMQIGFHKDDALEVISIWHLIDDEDKHKLPGMN